MALAEGTGNMTKRAIVLLLIISAIIIPSAFLIWQVKMKKEKRKGKRFSLAIYIHEPKVLS